MNLSKNLKIYPWERTKTSRKTAGLDDRKRNSVNILSKLLACVFVLGLCLYLYIDRQNEITELRLTVPALTDDIRVIQEKNARLQYGIERFESPLRLMELLRKPEFRHLKHPYVSDILEIPAGEPLKTHDQIK